MSALETLLAIPTVADDRELAVVLTFGEVWRQSQQPDRVAVLERFIAGNDPEHYIGIAAARIAAYRIRLSEERLQAEALAEAMADSTSDIRAELASLREYADRCSEASGVYYEYDGGWTRGEIDAVEREIYRMRRVASVAFEALTERAVEREQPHTHEAANSTGKPGTGRITEYCRCGARRTADYRGVVGEIGESAEPKRSAWKGGRS